MPSLSEEWKKIASAFGTKCQFWNCLGAIDGKHIAIKNLQTRDSCIIIIKDFLVLFCWQ